MSKLIRRILDGSSHENRLALGVRPIAQPSSEDDSAALRPSTNDSASAGRDDAEVTHPEPRHAPDERAAPGATEDWNFAELGEHIAALLHSATDAGNKMRDEARRDAELLRGRSQEEAKAVLEAARQEADQLVAEAERLRSEAERQHTEMRQRADAYAIEKERDAEARASRVLAGAEHAAEELREAAEQRQQALKQDIDLKEKRLRELAGRVSELTASLNYFAKPQEVGRSSTSPNSLPSSSSRTSYPGGDHWIQSVSADGKIVVLEDRSVWQISPPDRVDTSIWLPVDKIVVTDSEDSLCSFRLVDTDDGTSAEARFLGY